MQSFLPYPDFQKSAEVLDHFTAGRYSRGWKQSVEMKQIICHIRASDMPSEWDSWFSDIPHMKDMYPLIRFEELSEAETELVYFIFNWGDPKEMILNRSFQLIGRHNYHPAIKMWRETPELAKHYYNIFLQHNIEVNKVRANLGYVKSKFSEPSLDKSKLVLTNPIEESDLPWWFSNLDIFRSHRARLIEKDPHYYSALFPDDIGFNQSLYIWPNMDNRTFYLSAHPWDPTLIDNSAYQI